MRKAYNNNFGGIGVIKKISGPLKGRTELSFTGVSIPDL